MTRLEHLRLLLPPSGATTSMFSVYVPITDLAALVRLADLAVALVPTLGMDVGPDTYASIKLLQSEARH